MADVLRTITADRGDAGRRLDLTLRRHLHDVRSASRTHIQSWIAGGQVAINGRTVRKVSARVAQHDQVLVTLPPSAVRQPMAAEATTLDVIFEDEYLLAVNKPAGLIVHPSYGHPDGTLMNALLWRARDWPAGARPSLVGRLDKHTSGIVIVAKTRVAHAALQQTMASARAEKAYLALVYGLISPGRGSIDLRLSRDPRDRRKVVASTATGAPSITRYDRIAGSTAAPVGLSLVRCRLMSGRMHQIRVHLAARGWPIVGDPKYGRSSWSRIADPALAAALRTFPRQALHAARVSLAHPFSARPLVIEAPLPADFVDLLRQTGF